MKKIIAGNWKMNGDFADIVPFVKYVKKNARKEDNMIICVPSVLIKSFAEKAKNLIATGAENCFYEQKGAFTGEISPNMIKSAGATYCIMGHSERRHILGETDEIINKKIRCALSAGLKVIFCVGETLEEKPKFKSIIKSQLLKGLDGVDLTNVIIAYEPVWAIGTGKVATLDDIKKVHGFIKVTVKEKFGFDALVLYGGSVKPSNSHDILALADVDGVLIGGASLKAKDFVEIVKSR